MHGGETAEGRQKTPSRRLQNKRQGQSGANFWQGKVLSVLQAHKLSCPHGGPGYGIRARRCRARNHAEDSASSCVSVVMFDGGYYSRQHPEHFCVLNLLSLLETPKSAGPRL
eukprot:2804785-Rhodomonas_salina.1